MAAGRHSSQLVIEKKIPFVSLLVGWLKKPANTTHTAVVTLVQVTRHISLFLFSSFVCWVEGRALGEVNQVAWGPTSSSPRTG